MNDDKRECAATPPDVLEAELMSFSVPKNEREWYAMKLITSLRTENDKLQTERRMLEDGAVARDAEIVRLEGEVDRMMKDLTTGGEK